MIQLKDLDMEMTEVLDCDLGSIVGGDSAVSGLSGLKSTGSLSSLVIKSEGNLLSNTNTSSLSYTTPGGWGFGADTSGSFSVKAPLGNSSNASVQYNVNTKGYQAQATWLNPFGN
jgi:hypothetical protein